ncbi:hypothetical protein A2W24_03150 [Microgenomates group bacterium RBG_16_45_19]|nr:MAG: hypothetical protein A2W24_03150 [Microgenomates group bacterium RBG_16_45_19]
MPVTNLSAYQLNSDPVVPVSASSPPPPLLVVAPPPDFPSLTIYRPLVPPPENPLPQPPPDLTASTPSPDWKKTVLIGIVLFFAGTITGVSLMLFLY